MADGMREPSEAACDECGDHYAPCECARVERLYGEHAELRDICEAIESRLERGMPIAHDDDLRVQLRKLLARVYR